ncbi:hypothetical protein GCM10011354_34550 [Egicoccus halophilus]|uniref:Uncharacterized protein n=1 Tax=Egicoccus halophilus TaxID=1670830 RepID=A0A8J3ADE5_9ACTN|nr:hypothetical protein GCM10011354_34550 [Egicoccus halophilus]
MIVATASQSMTASPFVGASQDGHRSAVMLPIIDVFRDGDESVDRAIGVERLPSVCQRFEPAVMA